MTGAGLATKFSRCRAGVGAVFGALILAMSRNPDQNHNYFNMLFQVCFNRSVGLSGLMYGIFNYLDNKLNYK
jgi:hypothetical protein